MKKIFLLTLVCLGFVVLATTQVKAQDSAANPYVNKRGIALLPAAGDFAIGIDAAPFLEYIGNMFNNSAFNPAPFANGLSNSLYGKYFLKDDVAVRAKLGMQFTNTKYKETVKDDYATVIDPTNVAATGVDVYSQKVQRLSLDLGYEMRRGKGRVQGFYGGGVGLGYGKVTHNYSYANAITENNQNPTTHNFDGIGDVAWYNPMSSIVSPDNTVVKQGYRMLKDSEGTEFWFGLGAFAGIEYFFAPQISIGAELTLAFDYYIKGQDNITTEGYLGDGVQEFQYRSRTDGDPFPDSKKAFDTGLRTTPVGSLFLMFHF